MYCSILYAYGVGTLALTCNGTGRRPFWWIYERTIGYVVKIKKKKIVWSHLDCSVVSLLFAQTTVEIVFETMRWWGYGRGFPKECRNFLIDIYWTILLDEPIFENFDRKWAGYIIITIVTKKYQKICHYPGIRISILFQKNIARNFQRKLLYPHFWNSTINFNFSGDSYRIPTRRTLRISMYSYGFSKS